MLPWVMDGLAQSGGQGNVLKTLKEDKLYVSGIKKKKNRLKKKTSWKIMNEWNRQAHIIVILNNIHRETWKQGVIQKNQLEIEIFDKYKYFKKSSKYKLSSKHD